jgi:transcriptional regulator with XRE-family HTH domain
MTRLPVTPANCPRCGGRLARDNDSGRCAACQAAERDRLIAPPTVPASFWEHEPIRQALTERHLGRLIRAYRCHPYHGRHPLPQTTVARWLGITQAQLSRIENGPAMVHLDRLIHWAQLLQIPAEHLWFKLTYSTAAGQEMNVRSGSTTRWREPAEIADTDEVTRRELLRLLTMGSALIGGQAFENIDWERVDRATSGSTRLDLRAAQQHEAVNASLWAAYGSAASKDVTAPMVHQQLGVLTDALRLPHPPKIHQRMCAAVADVLQLAGELAFDGRRFDEAGRCYSLATIASREAEAFDLWACAMTRYAYLSLYQQSFADAKSMLDAAMRLAANGDSSLSTRQWVQSVRAQSLAHLGLTDECRRSLDAAESVHLLTNPVHNRGWLRFDGSRIAEERGSCYVALGRPDLAEPILADTLNHSLSVRRRGIVLTDLALIGVQRGDAHQAVHYGAAALDTERQSHSGVLKQRLQGLQEELRQFGDDQHVRHLSQEIAVAVKTRTV